MKTIAIQRHRNTTAAFMPTIKTMRQQRIISTLSTIAAVAKRFNRVIGRTEFSITAQWRESENVQMSSVTFFFPTKRQRDLAYSWLERKVIGGNLKAFIVR